MVKTFEQAKSEAEVHLKKLLPDNFDQVMSIIDILLDFQKFEIDKSFRDEIASLTAKIDEVEKSLSEFSQKRR